MIVVRVSAKNGKGYSQPSNVNVEGLHLKNPIPETVEVTLGEKTADSIELLWKAPKGENLTYDVLWNNGKGETYTNLGKINKTGWTVPGLANDGNYKFKVRVCSTCGCGDESKRLFVTMAQPPAQMKPISLRVEGCAMLVEWEKPQD